MTCGVYCIRNGVTGDCYVGMSCRIETRWRQHKSKLNTGKHTSKTFVNDWNLYGEASFSFEILEICAPDVISGKLYALERQWIRKLNPKYNVDPFREQRDHYMSELMTQRYRRSE